MINCILIDDEAPARNILKKYLEQIGGFHILAECTNGFEGFKAIKDLSPDLIFLDIQMPKLDGFELLELLESPPEVVFVTAFDQFAIKAFDKNAIDYLLKPYSFERFSDAVSKIKKRLEEKQEEPTEAIPNLIKEVNDNREVLDRVVVKNGTKIEIFPVKDIRYIKAEDDYVMIYTTKGRFLKKATMQYFEEHLPADQFVRIHRSYIINTLFIQRMERYGKETLIVRLQDNTEIKTSKSGTKRLKSALGI